MLEYLQIALIVAAVGYVLFARFRGQPPTRCRAAVLPLVLSRDRRLLIAHVVPHGLTGADVSYLIIGGVTVFAIGVLRGMSVRIYQQDGVL